MPQQKLTTEDVLSCREAWLAHGKSRRNTAKALGLSVPGVQRRLEAYRDRYGTDDADRGPYTAPASIEALPDMSFEDVLVQLRKEPMELSAIADAIGDTKSNTLNKLYEALARGVNLHTTGDKWTIGVTPPLRPPSEAARYELVSDQNNGFRFGFVTDNHLGSKYARLDVLNDMYERFARQGITAVFNAGNYIDGEKPFNMHDLKVHGMDAQLRFLAQEYPRHDGITTYFVAGDDHEGWYGQREGIEIGRHTERVMREAGREDFKYLGYMEADVNLVNFKTGKSARMRVAHPGGGSSYAVSYTMQKLVESYDGGDKPAVLLGGHYHKLEILNYRNVWCIQGGCTQDQTPFLRKKKIEVHVGGIIVNLEQDQRTGAIVACNGMYRYFTREYYRPEVPRGERFSYGGGVALPNRSLGGV